MGKASRRRKDATIEGSPRRARVVPFVRRPFEGLSAETEWVALREILPAATATVTWAEGRAPQGAPAEATLATVLPLAWPGLHRGDGTVMVGMQSGGSSGDASRDLAAQLLAAASVEAGTPVVHLAPPTADTPRLQDLLVDEPFLATVHDGFEFWVGDQELEGDAKESLDRANESVVPTSRMAALPSAFWVRIGDRTHIRLVLGDDEDAATDALARLHAAGEDALGGPTRLLGAFRACGLLVPVWDLDPGLEATDYEQELAAWGTRYAAALASDAPLTAEERRARSGLLSRQVTLR
ncbi:MAG: DUF5926 family protein [Nostocoides sp.]